MRILIYSDNHFCERFSIVNKLGTKYSLRLENQIASLNWAEKLAEERGCRYIICAGDFFDKPQLTDQELTALRDVRWAKLPHYFLVGNHESEENDLRFSSVKALEDLDKQVIAAPVCLNEGSYDLAFLPYIAEAQRKPLAEYFDKPRQKRLLISHNDLMGVQMGPVVSRTGFEPKELEEFSTLTINGHLHNGQRVTDRVINIGNLTGKDFGENALLYKHGVIIVNTDDFSHEFIENPFAFNFYKLEISAEKDLKKLDTLKDNAVVTVQCKAALLQTVRESIAKSKKIVESRVILKQEESAAASADIVDLSVDQYAKFVECCRMKLENNDILEAELAEVLK